MLAGSVLALAALSGGPGCSSDSGGTAAPELKQVLVPSAGGMDLDLLAPPDGGVGAVSPTAALKLVFNQLLDGDKIETVLDGGGFMGKTDVASIAWTGAPAGAPAITAVTNYYPGGALDVNTPGPSVLVHFDPGLPSGAMLALTLVRDKITSKKGTPFVGADHHTMETVPFAATASVIDGDTVAPQITIKVTFTNLAAEAIADALSVTAGGAPVAVMAAKDETDPLVWVLTPKAGAWPVGTDYTLSVGKDAADLFGVKVAAPLAVKFAVATAAGDGGSPDGGGSGTPDGAGGAADGGADGGTDAASDGP